MNKYGPKARKTISTAMFRYKIGTLKSGKSREKVKNRKQALAIGISKARKAGDKVPKNK